MPEIDFEVTGAEAVPYAAAPLLNLKLRLTNRDANEQIQNVMLRCQINLEVTRRQYNDAEKRRMFDLFGEPERWGANIENNALDARERRRAAVCGNDFGRFARALHV